MRSSLHFKIFFEGQIDQFDVFHLGQPWLDRLSDPMVVLDAVDPLAEKLASCRLLCHVVRSEGRLFLGVLHEFLHARDWQSVLLVLCDVDQSVDKVRVAELLLDGGPFWFGFSCNDYDSLTEHLNVNWWIRVTLELS